MRRAMSRMAHGQWRSAYSERRQKRAACAALFCCCFAVRPKPATRRVLLPAALPVARVPNFLLNFSTRPAVSMIFCGRCRTDAIPTTLRSWRAGRSCLEFGGFTRLDGRARHKLEVVRHVDEQDFAVIRVNAFFHGLSFNLAVANPRAAAFERFGPHLGASHLPMVEKRRLCQKISRLTTFAGFLPA